MHTKLIVLKIHPRFLIFNPYKKTKKAHILNLSTLLVMGLSTFDGPFNIWNSFIDFMANEVNSPYIMPHVVFKLHSVNYMGNGHGEVTPLSS
jgi:hypothetical protein